MDHAYIEEHDIADRYVTGTLEPAEAERFEEHYLSCQICLDRLELAEAMKRGFTRVAEKEAAKRAAVSQLALVAWLSRLGRQRQFALLAAVLVLLLLPTGLSFYGFAARDRALAAARSAHQAEARVRSDLAAREHDLATLRAARAGEPHASISTPLGGFPIVSLDQVRGAAGEPALSLRQPAPGKGFHFTWIVDRPYSPAYTAILQSNGKDFWQGPVLDPDENGNMELIIPGAFIPLGVDTLLVQGQSRNGKLTPAGRFTFRVLPRT